ncbi:unnamed protein product [Mycena citricolor]|uniref:Uncharacterized protein n=1 Tax=Mycena citricolor TaxID=2018698 RepID=A0AAD2GU03_9AGAR|nr:unnamed protein product [Mycena citricolor]
MSRINDPIYISSQETLDALTAQIHGYIAGIVSAESGSRNASFMQDEIRIFKEYLERLHLLPGDQRTFVSTLIVKIIGDLPGSRARAAILNMWKSYEARSRERRRGRAPIPAQYTQPVPLPVEPYAREPSLFSIDLSSGSSQHSQISSYHSARYPTMPMGLSGHSYGARINLPVPAGTPGFSPPRTSADSGNSEQWPIPGPVNNDHLYALPNPHHGRMQEAIYRQNVGKPGWYSPLPPPHRDHRDPDYPTGVVFGTPDSGHHASSSYGGNPQ